MTKHFSALQKFILRSCYFSSSLKVGRQVFMKYYQTLVSPPKHTDQVNSLTKSLESLIDRSLLVGYGQRTPRKWFIQEVRLTPLGRRLARRLLGEQGVLPFKINKLKK